jgi:receptor protein-tyrosine kinase
MSIVERALQKAQLTGRKDGVPPPSSPAAAPPPPPAESFASQAADRVQSQDVEPTEDFSSLTSRDLKMIVQLDFERLRVEGRVPANDLARQVDDEVRRIKWPLLNAISGQEGVEPARNNVVLVTSALPGEGKTFTSLNLALSIVRDREMRVVLVDGDVACPGLTPALGLEGRAGLNDVLEDTSLDVSAVTYQTDVPGLFFVPAGRWNEHAPEFFAGSRMPQVIQELSRRVGHGVIMFDSPPLLATNEAQALTRYVGQVLLVVRADETEQQAVVDALALVDRSATVQAVLNRVTPSLVSRYYGQYYYGYGANYGADRARTGMAGKGNR